jgi:serine/threonine-protein kinase mTOR
MGVLREKSDSLNAMLEAFVHDPLIGWKLLSGDKSLEGAEESEKALAGGAVNEQALRVTRRIQMKLNGEEFLPGSQPVAVEEQVSPPSIFHPPPPPPERPWRRSKASFETR